MLRRLLLCTLAALALSAPAMAQRGPGGVFADQLAPPEDRNDRDREVSLGVIQRDLKSRYGGELLDAQKQGDRYRISWLAGDGRRLTIEVSAKDGRVLSVR